MNRPFKIVLIYLLSAFIWIIFSDQVIKSVFESMNPDQILFWQTAKGLVFVILTSAVLFVLVKKGNDNLAVSERQYRELFTSNPNPMWVYNLNTYQFVEINQAAVEKYGYSREEFLSMTVLDIRPQEDKDKVIAFIDKIRKRQDTSGYWTHNKKNGDKLIASIKSFPVNFNGQKCAMVLAIDITERINHQRQLEESYRKEIELNEALATHIELIKKSNEEKRRLGEIIEKINNFVFIIENSGTLRWANKAFLEFSQYSIAEISGEAASTFFFNEDKEGQAALVKALSNQEYYSCELCSYTKDNNDYWVQMDISPIYDENGRLDCFIAIQTLITERKIREEKIQQQNRTLRQLAWVSSHELRKPVSSIISLVNLLKDMKDGIERAECFQLLEECSVELDNLVKDVAKKVNIAEGEQPLV